MRPISQGAEQQVWQGPTPSIHTGVPATLRINGQSSHLQCIRTSGGGGGLKEDIQQHRAFRREVRKCESSWDLSPSIERHAPVKEPEWGPQRCSTSAAMSCEGEVRCEGARVLSGGAEVQHERRNVL